MGKTPIKGKETSFYYALYLFTCALKLMVSAEPLSFLKTSVMEIFLTSVAISSLVAITPNLFLIKGPADPHVFSFTLSD